VCLHVCAVLFEHLGVEAVDENGVARTVDELRGQEDRLFFTRRGIHERHEALRDVLFADGEGCEDPLKRAPKLRREIVDPLPAIAGEIDCPRLPLLALPQVVELPVARSLFLYCRQDVVDGNVAQLCEFGLSGHGAVYQYRSNLLVEGVLLTCSDAKGHLEQSRVRGLGTLMNLATVTLGGIAGVFIGGRLSERMRETVMQGIGLVTIAVAVVGFEPLFNPDHGLKRFVIMIIAVILGAIGGEALRLEDRLESVGEKLKRRLGTGDEAGDPVSVPPNRPLERRELPANGDGGRSTFVEGFVVASTVFCAGPLTVLGSVEDGLGISIRLLAIKSTLDGFAAIGFASVYGWGVLGSLVTIAVYQGALTLAAAAVEPALTTEVLAELGAIGSLLVLGIGLRLLQIARVRVVNLMPALFLGPLMAGVYDALA
jgi:uncharacterized membrane protein YqgA involved in biofilm formation